MLEVKPIFSSDTRVRDGGGIVSVDVIVAPLIASAGSVSCTGTRGRSTKRC